MNAELNGVSLATTTEDLVGRRDAAWDVVMAGDVFYGSEMATGVLAWLLSLAADGTLVLMGDANRGFLDVSRLDVRRRFDAPADNDHDGSFMQCATVFAIRPGC